MKSTQTSPMFISLPEAEEANLSGGQSIINGQDGAPGQAGAPGQDGAGASGQDGAGASGQDGVSVQNGVSGQTAIQNVQRYKLIRNREELLERLLCRIKRVGR